MEEWFTLNELAEKWGKPITWIEKQLLSGKLKPSAFLPDMKWKRGISYEADENGPYSIEHEYVYLAGGLFDINGYLNIKWHYHENGKVLTNLSEHRIIFSNDSNECYELVNSFEINKDDILISLPEIIRFEAQNRTAFPLPSPQPPQQSPQPQPQLKAPPAKESTRKIETLQKIVIAMAMDWYNGYDPKTPNPTVADIRIALHKVGLSVSDNTIRENLKAGFDIVEQEKKQ